MFCKDIESKFGQIIQDGDDEDDVESLIIYLSFILNLSGKLFRDMRKSSLSGNNRHLETKLLKDLLKKQ